MKNLITTLFLLLLGMGAAHAQVCLGDECESAVVIPGETFNTAQCVQGCNEGATPGAGFSGCFDFPSPTVWYELTVDDGETLVQIEMTSTNLNNPQIAVYTSADCSAYTLQGCVVGVNGMAELTAEIPLNGTCLIAISDNGGLEGDFELCVTSLLDNSLCNTDDSLVEQSSSDADTPVGGPYSPGESVEFCYTINQFRKVNCNWLKGIVPSFGGCWDASSFDTDGMPAITTPLQVAGNQNGNWGWHPNGAVQYNNLGGGGALPDGSDVGAGWFFVLTDQHPTDPNQTFGDGGAPGPEVCDPDGNGFTWTVCFLLVAGDGCQGGVDCSFSIKTYADGELGAWTDVGCTGDSPTIHNAYLEAENNCDASFSSTSLSPNIYQLSATGIGESEWTINDIPVGAGSPLTTPWLPEGDHDVCHTFTDDCGQVCVECIVLSVIGACHYGILDSPYDCDNLSDNTACVPMVAPELLPDGIQGFDFCIQYDPLLFQPTGNVELGDVVLAATTDAEFDISIGFAGTVCVSIYYGAGAPPEAAFSGTGEVACVEFEATPAFMEGMSATFIPLDVFEIYESQVQTQCGESGVINFEDIPEMEIAGQVTYWGDIELPLSYNASMPGEVPPTYIKAATSSCSVGSVITQTGDGGNFILPSGTPYVTLERDILGSTPVMEYINGMDVFWMNLAATLDPLFVPSPHQIIAMDVDMDGTVSPSDVTFLTNRIVLNIEEFPQAWNEGLPDPSKDWLFVDKPQFTSSEYMVSDGYPFPGTNGGYHPLNVPAPPFCVGVSIDEGGLCPRSDSLLLDAILLGDVDKSWSGGENGLRLGGGGTVSLDMSNAVIEDDCVMSVPIMIEGVDFIRAVDFSLDYNNEKMDFIGFEGVLGMGLAYNGTQEGRVLFTTYAQQGGGVQVGDGLPIHAKFTILDPEAVVDANFSFSSAFIDGIPTNHQALSNPITCESSSVGQIILLPDGGLDIYLDNYPSNMEFTIRFYDMTGRLIQKETFFGKSSHIPNTHLPKGIYIYELQGNGKPIKTGRLALL